MFKYSDSNKRYHTLDYFYRNKFGCKVFMESMLMALWVLEGVFIVLL